MPDFQRFWRQRGFLNVLLLPLTALFIFASAVRRYWLTRKTAAATTRLPPIIVVGNIVVGGSGKTPVVINLAEQLVAHGYKPGIISRGYGGSMTGTPLLVEDTTDWRHCGDEPLLIRRRTRLPVCVAKNRVRAAEKLTQNGCNVLISDDGLQHYALPRTVEICVTDADYRFGNGWRLPAGPLRESRERAKKCTFHLLINADENDNDAHAHSIGVQKKVRGISPLSDPQTLRTAAFAAGKTIAAIAGIARPQDFFRTVENYRLPLKQKVALADHAQGNLNAIDADIIIMSEKDAVKYPADDTRLFMLSIDCPLPPTLITAICSHLQH